MSNIRILIIATTLGLLSFGCSNRPKDQLTIATAASAQYAMQALCDSFENKYDISCNVVTGSSGQLTAQIKEGAPFDVFVSANIKYPTALYNDHLSSAPPKVFAYGTLVLWSTTGNLPSSPEELKDKKYNHIAMADPLNAPYGQATMECLEYYHILDSIKPRLVYGASISQTNQYIVSGEASVGFTARSVVMATPMKDTGQWAQVPEEAYSQPAQSAIVINTTLQPEKAQKFYTFLFSKEGRAILVKYGYKPAE